MKINAQELLLMNKKVLFKEGEGTSSIAITPEVPEEAGNIQTGMNALMFQGMTNLMSNPALANKINFMKEDDSNNAEINGSISNEADASKPAFKGVKDKAMTVTAGILAGMTLLNSCIKKEDYTSINIDMESINAAYSALAAAIKEMKDADEQRYNQFMAQFQLFLNMYKDSEATREEFYKAATLYMMTSLENDEFIKAQLVANGVSTDNVAAEVAKLRQDIKKIINDTNMTWEEKFNALMALLGHIDTTVTEISQSVKQLVSDFQRFAKSYEENEKQQTEYLKNIYKEEKYQSGEMKFQSHIAAQSLYTQQRMAEDLKGLRKSTNEFKEIVKNNHKELIELLGNNHEEYMAMLGKMGISIEDALKMSKEELIAAIEKFENTYIKTEEEKSQKMNYMLMSLDSLKFFNGVNTMTIVKALSELSEAMAKGDDAVLAKLDDVLKAIEAVKKEIKAVNDKITRFTLEVVTRLDAYKAKVDAMFGVLLGMARDIGVIKKDLKTANASLYVANSQLAALRKDLANLKGAVDELKDKIGDRPEGITYAELKELWGEENAELIKALQEMFDKLNITPDDHARIEELLASIDSKLDGIEKGNDLLQQLLDKATELAEKEPNKFLENFDEIMEILRKAKEHYETGCNCNCGEGSSHEGILGGILG